MEFQVGETHSGYEFLDVLKRSKNGIEFRVRNTLIGRIEALRAIPEELQNDREHAGRLLREMRLHAGLVHQNIVTLFNAVELGNQMVITTELVEGQTVAEKLQHGPFPWPEAVAITRQMLSALGYAHQQGIVHRAISPGNMILGASGTIKLANFALAKGLDSPRLTQVGVAIGNLKYTSPEQIRGKGDVDGRSDLYSLGMVLYEMLCGRPAFVMDSEFEIMAAHVGVPPALPETVHPQVPREFASVLLKALAKNPADRYQTAVEFDQALVRVAEGPKTFAAPAAAAAPSATEPAIPPMAPVAVDEPQPARNPFMFMKSSEASRITFTQFPLQTPPPPAIVAVPSAPVLSRQQIILASAAGACTGVLMAVVWLFTK